MADESSIRSKRERKPVDVFKASPIIEKREEVIPEGEGTALGDIPFANQKLTKLKEDDDLLKSLHALIYGGLGKAGDRKRKLRLFSGFDRDTEISDKEYRVIENKKWTVSKLKQACDCFGLQKLGTREELSTRLVKYLAVPYAVKDISGKSASPSSSKRLSKSPKGKTKASKIVKKRKSRGKSTGSAQDTPAKKKRAPSGYILFSTSKRQEVKEANPDSSFTDLTKILGELWNNLDDEEKQEWLDKSEKLKNDLKTEEVEAEEEVADEEEEEEEEEEDNDADQEEEEADEEKAEEDKEEDAEDEQKDQTVEMETTEVVEPEVDDKEEDTEEKKENEDEKEEEKIPEKNEVEVVEQQLEDDEVDALVSEALQDQPDDKESGHVSNITIEEPADEVSNQVAPVDDVENENVVVEEVE